MFKIKIYLFFFYFFLTSSLYSSENNCYSQLPNAEAQKIFDSIPENISIEIKQSRNWYKNIFEVLVEREKKQNQFSNNSVLSKRNKQRFRATIKVHYKNNIICSFRGRTRLSGDLKDHIQIIDGNYFTSVDVKLDNGNINGIVDFKLLIPETRKDPNYEILFTNFLSELDILAPRTFLIDAKINNLNKKMLFQEKIKKEMLEFNNRVEGPLLEGSERYMFTFLENNNPFFNAGINNQIARITNPNWAEKSKNHLKISNQALTELNKVYLKWIYEMDFGRVNLSHYNLNENILSNDNNISSEKLGIFSSLMYAAGARHGMSPHNRKFYWNSVTEYFEPIYYDGDITINQATNHLDMFKDDKINFTTIKSNNVDKAIKKIEKLDKEKLYKKFKKFGGKLTEEEIVNFFTKLLDNLIILQNYILKKDFVSNEINDIILENYYNFLVKTKTKTDNIKAVFTNLNEEYLVCDLLNQNCNKVELEKEEISELIADELIKNNSIYQYIGIIEKFENRKEKESYKNIKIKNSNLYYDENIKIEYNEDQNILNIYQNSSDARAYFLNGNLNNININFIGLNSNKDIEKQPAHINDIGLTGCLSFININFDEVQIKGSKGACEDTINLVNSKGKINKIEIEDAFSDALDLDFSNIKVKDILVNKSKNDCADFSYGDYMIEKFNLNNCGDKALSVGERSILNTKEINIQNSKIGIASKDGSIVNIEKNNSNNLEICLAAYNKKQEFFGGFIKVDDFLCENSKSKIEIDQFSQIKTLNINLE